MSTAEIETPTASASGVFVPPSRATGESQEIDLLETLLAIARHKRAIVRFTAVVGVIAAMIAFLLPSTYTATAVIMPPQQAQSTLAALLGQIGALAGMNGKGDLSLKNPGDLWAGILRSQSIADGLVDRFDLRSVYAVKYWEKARKKLGKRTDISAGKEGLITIEVEDQDPKRAADLANGYVEELYKLNSRLAVTESGQRRLFFEKQLERERDELGSAELKLKQLQEHSGVIQLDTQSKAIIESVAALKGQLAAKEVQLRAMSSYATSRNPDYRVVESELLGLRAQLAKVEHDSQGGDGDIQVATRHVPEKALEYVRLYRTVKYHETIFELLAKQMEAARLDEARSASVIQVVDHATVPERRSGPPRLLIITASMAAAALLACLFVLLLESLRTIARDPVRGATLVKLRSELGL